MTKKYIFCFDLDNTICTTNKSNYKSSKPNKKAIRTVNQLYRKGFMIKIYTARYMGRNSENVNLAKKQGRKLTVKQLKNWNVSYHKLIFGKPSFDILIDDKSIFYKKNWHTSISKKYNLDGI